MSPTVSPAHTAEFWGGLIEGSAIGGAAVLFVVLFVVLIAMGEP